MTTTLNEEDTKRDLARVFDQLSPSDCQVVLACLQSIADERNEALGRIEELERLQAPQRIDADTPDNVLAWDGEEWEPIHRGLYDGWMHASTLYCDPQPTHYLPMPPAPVDGEEKR